MTRNSELPAEPIQGPIVPLLLIRAWVLDAGFRRYPIADAAQLALVKHWWRAGAGISVVIVCSGRAMAVVLLASQP